MSDPSFEMVSQELLKMSDMMQKKLVSLGKQTSLDYVMLSRV